MKTQSRNVRNILNNIERILRECICIQAEVGRYH